MIGNPHPCFGRLIEELRGEPDKNPSLRLTRPIVRDGTPGLSKNNVDGLSFLDHLPDPEGPVGR
jgi:hypothetical protein